MRDAGILERQNSYCKFTCLMQTHYLLTSQQMQPAPGGAWCVFDNESPSISSSAKGDSPCCHRSLCNICHRATNKPFKASARGQKLGQRTPLLAVGRGRKTQYSREQPAWWAVMAKTSTDTVSHVAIILKHEAFHWPKSLQSRPWGECIRY